MQDKRFCLLRTVLSYKSSMSVCLSVFLFRVAISSYVIKDSFSFFRPCQCGRASIEPQGTAGSGVGFGVIAGWAQEGGRGAITLSQIIYSGVPHRRSKAAGVLC